MYHKFVSLILCVFLTFLSGCFLKKDKADSGLEKLPKLGVAMKIPENFSAVPREILDNIETLGAMTLTVQPFNVNPLYAYMNNSGNGMIVISELKFMEDASVERFAMNNIYAYKKNLEERFASGEISSEEMGNDDISTILLAMVFQEDSDDIFLFKGLSYIYPNRYFMIDLYVVNRDIAESDALEYMNMFNSLSIY